MSYWLLLVPTIFLVIGFLFACLFFKWNNRHTSGNGSGSRRDNPFGQDEIGKLQSQIDEINEEIKRYKRKGRSKYSESVSSRQSDYFFTCSEFNDFDTFGAWNTDRHETGKEDSSFKLILNFIDKKLEAGFTDADLKQLLNVLEELSIENPGNVELLYRIGKIYAELAGGKPDDVVKHYTEKGLKACETALKSNDKHAEAHKCYALLLSLSIQYASGMELAKRVFLFKKHCDLVLVLNPKDAMMHYFLGNLDFHIASLNWIQKIMARYFFGNDMDATYDKALNRFLMAERLAPLQSFSANEKKMNKMMIGKCLVQLKRQKEAVAWLVKAQSVGSTGSDLDNEVSCLIQKYR